MHSILNISKNFFLRNYLSKQIIKPSKSFFCEFNSKLKFQNTQTITDNKDKSSESINNANNSQQNLNKITENTSDKIAKPEKFEIPKELKTRKEEVMFYIMHDKYSVRPDKEYRISHTTLESTDIKTKMKDLNVLYYGKNKIL